MNDQISCTACGSPDSDFGAHGVHNGEVYSEHFCSSCWHKREDGWHVQSTDQEGDV